jgi:hypothetical protein
MSGAERREGWETRRRKWQFGFVSATVAYSKVKKPGRGGGKSRLEKRLSKRVEAVEEIWVREELPGSGYGEGSWMVNRQRGHNFGGAVGKAPPGSFWACSLPITVHVGRWARTHALLISERTRRHSREKRGFAYTIRRPSSAFFRVLQQSFALGTRVRVSKDFRSQHESRPSYCANQ